MEGLIPGLIPALFTAAVIIVVLQSQISDLSKRLDSLERDKRRRDFESSLTPHARDQLERVEAVDRERARLGGGAETGQT